MLASLQPYVGYADGTSHSTHNLSSTAWEIYTPNDELVSFQGIWINYSTNNIAKYSGIIKLLSNSISRGIHHLVFRLDSQLMVLHLNNVYS